MSEIKINLNEVVKVKLTDLGKDIYCRWYDKLMANYGRTIHEPKLPKEDDKGYTCFQLWNFMEIYGKYIGMANPNVIDPLGIIYELPKEEV